MLRKGLTISEKLKFIKHHEEGVSLEDLRAQFHVGSSTALKIIQLKENLKKFCRRKP